MTDTLTGPAIPLGQHMSDISEDTHCAGWLIGTEWCLWRALQDWRATGRAYWSPRALYPSDITEYMPRLDELQRQAAGWVWWLDVPDVAHGGMRFVTEDRWLRLVQAREANPSASNEELDLLVPAGAPRLTEGEAHAFNHQTDHR